MCVAVIIIPVIIEVEGKLQVNNIINSLSMSSCLALRSLALSFGFVAVFSRLRLGVTDFSLYRARHYKLFGRAFCLLPVSRVGTVRREPRPAGSLRPVCLSVRTILPHAARSVVQPVEHEASSWSLHDASCR